MTHLTDQLDALVRDGATLNDCEEWVERQTQLTGQERDWLWLYSWTILPSEHIKQEMTAMFGLLG